MENRNKSKKYLGKRKEEYNKRGKINKTKSNLNKVLERSNGAPVSLETIFSQPEFQNFVQDVKSRVQKLNKEYVIQQANYRENEVPKEISNLANALNDYTNDLVGFYEKSYFHIENENERKRFIRDLKMIIGTYGKLQENLHNIVYEEKNKK